MQKWWAGATLALVTLPLLSREAAGASAEGNPLLAEWETPFGVPPFDRIKEEHFLPAYHEAIARQREEAQAIAKNTAAPSFVNTVEALAFTGDLLERVASVFGNLTSAHTNDALQAIARQVAPLTAALQDDILLDEALFARVKAVWEQREALNLEPEQRKLLEETYKRFVRGGADLGPEKKQRLREINQRLSVLGVKFADNVLKETNAFRLAIEKREDLAGLPATQIAAAAEAAQAAKLPGKWLFTLHAPSIWPFLQYSDNRELRRQIMAAYLARGDRDNAEDNKTTLAETAALRAEKAQLLGYPTWAAFVLEERMAKTPEKVHAFLEQLWKPALAVARREAEALQAAIHDGGQQFRLEPCDWRYYAEKVRKARYDLDETAVRPYFSLGNMLEAAFYVAGRLYGLSFQERADIPRYHPEVRAFEVKDADGSHLGVFLADYHPRPSKRFGAWSSRFRSQEIRDGKDIRPVVLNVGNFTRPTADTPALLSIEEVETLFHEMGHGLHSLLSRIHYRSLSAVPRDFVELPSQIMEHWVLQPEVLRLYARHFRTGEVIPDELVAKIEKARRFNQGFESVEYLAASLLDMDWHTLAETNPPDVLGFEKASLARMGLIPEIPPRYRSAYFSHVFAGGYSAGYYSYIWSEVLDTDAFAAFEERGIFDQATATSFRKNILERGGTDDAMAMWLRFRGREPSIEPLLEKRGLKPEPAASSAR